MKKSMLLFTSICSLSLATNLAASNTGYKAYNIEDSEYVEKNLYTTSNNAASKLIADTKFENNLQQAKDRNNKSKQLINNSKQATTPTKLVVGSAAWAKLK